MYYVNNPVVLKITTITDVGHALVTLGGKEIKKLLKKFKREYL